MNLSLKAEIPSNIMTRQVGDEIVILDLARGTYYGLDTVGTRIWQLMASGESLSTICDKVIKEFDVTRETLELDLDRLFRDLVDKGLLTISS